MRKSNFVNILDTHIHLKICVLLSSTKFPEFRIIRDELALSNPVLSVHIEQLVDAGYIKQLKNTVNGQQRRWFNLTSKDGKAFELYVKELTRILNDL